MDEVEDRPVNPGSGMWDVLPPEVLETIFIQPVLKKNDLRNLSLTCKLFQEISQSNELWKQKFKQRWTNASMVRSPECFILEWREIYKQKIIAQNICSEKLDQLAAQTHSGRAKVLKAENERLFYSFLDHPDFSSNVTSEFRLDLVTQELLDLINTGDPFLHLTKKYYAEKSLWYLRHLHLTPKVEQYVSQGNQGNQDNQDLGEQDIEEGITLIAQWFQPTLNFTLESVKGQFDSLAKEVKQALFISEPNHRIFQESSPPIPDILESSVWKPSECKSIIQAIETVFSPIFNRDFDQYYVKENSFINLVLEDKKGIPITLCLTVQAVANRLGVKLSNVNFPRHFLLCWEEHPMREGVKKFSFVDPFNKKYFLSYEGLLLCFSSHDMPIREVHCRSCSNQEVLERVLRNLVNIGKNSHSGNDMHFLRYTVELFTLFDTADEEMSVLAMQLKLHLKVNLLSILNTLQEMRAVQPGIADFLVTFQRETERVLEELKTSEPTIKKPKPRADNPNVKFASGMLMMHKRYDYLCVIYGWDSKCEASWDWVAQMGVNRLEHKTEQPFYHVYVMDGSDRYAAQESLMMVPQGQARMITHPEVGKYFENFTGHFYRANRGLQEMYPDDLAVTEEAIGALSRRGGGDGGDVDLDVD